MGVCFARFSCAGVFLQGCCCVFVVTLSGFGLAADRNTRWHPSPYGRQGVSVFMQEMMRPERV